jgi:hypothetical protein
LRPLPTRAGRPPVQELPLLGPATSRRRDELVAVSPKKLVPEDRFHRHLGASLRRGTLLRSVEDPRRVYSFGPWPSAEAIASMRADPGTPAAIGRLTA